MLCSLFLISFLCFASADIINSDGNGNAESSIYNNCLHACDDQPYGHQIADPMDCTGYFLCHGYMIIQQYCEAGKVFNMAAQKCIPGRCPPCIGPPPPTTATPPSNSTPSSSNSTIPPSNSTLFPPNSTLPPPNSTLPPPNSTQIPPASNDPDTPDCSGVENGHIFPHSIHCRFFWQCVENRPVRRFCEKGMWYDRDHYVCNYPSAVQNCPANQD